MIHPARQYGRTLAVLAMILCASWGGCGNEREAATKAPGESENEPTEKVVQRGPVKLTVRTDKSRISIAEKLRLTVELEALDGIDVDMPSYGETLNEFEVMDIRERSAVPVMMSGEPRKVGAGEPAAGDTGLRASGRRWVREYVLESFLSGELEVPAVSVPFEDRRDPAEVVRGEIASEPFTIQVTSLLDGEFDPTQFRDIKGTVELPLDRRRTWLWWSLGILATAAAILLLAGLLRRRRRRAAMPKPLLPHEWAFFAFQRLEEDQLVERGRVQEFYFRLSGIVREYIERRFGLMAPERTTPEFLAEVRSDSSLSGEHKTLLGQFLQAADMVKFARYEPAPTEVQTALGTARAFVDQTTPCAPGGRTDTESTPGDDTVRLQEVGA